MKFFKTVVIVCCGSFLFSGCGLKGGALSTQVLGAINKGSSAELLALFDENRGAGIPVQGAESFIQQVKKHFNSEMRTSFWSMPWSDDMRLVAALGNGDRSATDRDQFRIKSANGYRGEISVYPCSKLGTKICGVEIRMDSSDYQRAVQKP